MEKIIVDKMKENIREDHSKWIYDGYTNCYMYAINLDMSIKDVDTDGYFRIGEISGIADNPFYSYESRLYSDLDALDFNVTKVDPNFILDNPEEWKIALYLGPDYEGYNEFHFCKQGYNQTWSHKNGWHCGIKYTDCIGDLIKDPSKAYMISRRCQSSIKYNYVSTYKLRLK